MTLADRRLRQLRPGGPRLLFISSGPTPALVVALVLLARSALAAEPLLNDSARSVREVREAALSPDGQNAVEAVTASTAEGGQPHLWLMSTDGKAARQLTSSSAETEPGEWAAAWTNDGSSLFFLAKRGANAKSVRLDRLAMTGGEAETLTLGRLSGGSLKGGWNRPTGEGADEAIDVDISAYEISPDSRWIAVLASDGESAERTAQVKKKDDAVEVGRDDVKKARLYLVEAASGQAWEITLSDQVETVRWSPASHELLVVTVPADQDLGPSARLWRVNAASGAAVALAGVPKTVGRPDWMVGGAVFFAQCREHAPPGCEDLYAYDFASAVLRDLTGALKGSFENGYGWSLGGKAVVTPVMVGEDERLARISLENGALSWIPFPQTVVSAVGADLGQHGWVFLAGGPLQPQTAFYAASLGAGPVKLPGPELTPKDWPATPRHRIAWKNGGLDLEGLLYLLTGASRMKALWWLWFTAAQRECFWINTQTWSICCRH